MNKLLLSMPMHLSNKAFTGYMTPAALMLCLKANIILRCLKLPVCDWSCGQTSNSAGINDKEGFYWDVRSFNSDVSVRAGKYRCSLVNESSKLTGNLGPVLVSAGFNFGKWFEEVRNSFNNF